MNPAVDHDLGDYVRVPTPDASLRRLDGTQVTLRALSTQRPVLLLWVPSSAPGRETMRTLAPVWQAQLGSRVDVVPVLSEHLHAGAVDTAAHPDALLAPDTDVMLQLGAATDTPSSVLLGTDGWLAGGPVAGTDAIAQFVSDIADALIRAASASQLGRRALVTFVEDEGRLIQQLLALRRSLRALSTQDTDLVAMGPADVLDRLPSDVVKIPQRPAGDDPVWSNYRYINSVACLNAEGSEQLLDYTHLLRTDVDTFIFPGWDAFRPDGFRWGTGGYSNSDEVRSKIVHIGSQFGLTHRGHTNIGSTWYGPTHLVRRTAALTEMLTKYILTDAFRDGPGSWPGWYRGVSTLYAGDIAVNHLAPEGALSPLLDSSSTSLSAANGAVHVHCWHTDEPFSKHLFASDRYTRSDAEVLPAGSVARLAMEYSFASLDDLANVDLAG